MKTIAIENLAFAITSPQFHVAYKLARNFGHRWASLPKTRYASAWQMSNDPVICTNHIHKICTYDMTDWEVGGITCPLLSEEIPAVVHVTGTGRLSWEVERDGTTTIRVWRPGTNNTPYCVAWVKVFGSQVLDTWVDEEKFLERHWDALVYAASLLVGSGVSQIPLPQPEQMPSYIQEMWDEGFEDELVA